MKEITCRILILSAVLGAASFTFAADEAKAVKVTGWVTEDHCGAKSAAEGHATCATRCVKEKSAKWALYVPEDKTVYVITDQEEAEKHNSKEVKVMAKMDKDKKTVTIVEWNWP